MRQLASLLIVWRLLCCCFQENLVESLYTLKCGLDQMTVQWPNGTFKECLHCEHCHPGRGLYPHKCGGTVTFPVIIECKKCDSGKTFSDTYDSSSCRRCQLCAEHEVVKKDCTLSSDTKCNETCNSDYFFSKLQQVCKRCSYCCLDGKDEEQPQCINKGLKAANRYCSPRPDRTCTPSTPTGTAISTESRSSTKHTPTGSVTPKGSVPPKGSGTPTSSVTPTGTVVYTVPLSSSPKHLNEPASQQQNGKISLILSSAGLGFIFVCIVLGSIYCLRKKIRRRRNRDCDLRNTSNVNEECAWFEKKGNKLGLPQLQNPGFVPTPQGSHAGTPCQTDDELDELPDVKSVDPKHSRGRPGRTEEIKADVSLRENQAELDNEEVKNAQTSGTVGGKEAQGGRERKHSRSGQILRRLPSISNDYQPLPVEDPDQPAEVSAGGPQRKRSRGNSILNALRKSSVHAVTGENTDQPSDQSWPPEEVTITPFPKILQAGSRVEFHCTVRGCQQVSYQWYKDEQELQGEDNSTLILNPLKVQDFGFYKCEVRRDSRYDSSYAESQVEELNVTPAEGKSYRELSEVFESDFNLRETVAKLLEKKTACRKAYKHVASHFNMKDVDNLEGRDNPGEDVLVYLETNHPNLTVYRFCKALKDKNIRRLDIANKLVGYLIQIDRPDTKA